MQPEPSPQNGTGLSLTLQPELLARMPGAVISGGPETAEEVRVPIASSTNGRGATSRRPRATDHSHSHSHVHAHEHDSDGAESDLESGESSSSLSDLRYILRWVKKSLPFLVILCSKLIIQHALGECRTAMCESRCLIWVSSSWPLLMFSSFRSGCCCRLVYHFYVCQQEHSNASVSPCKLPILGV